MNDLGDLGSRLTVEKVFTRSLEKGDLFLYNSNVLEYTWDIDRTIMASARDGSCAEVQIRPLEVLTVWKVILK